DGAQKVQASEQDMASLATAVEAMCGDFSQRSQRQRTLSWVSSAQSSNGASTAGGQHGRDSVDNAAGSEQASRRQHVRLTTIDPVTGCIAELMRMSGQDQP
ncbi:hypothetical protein H4R23_006785, partial [Coemansia sp. Cherry 401B]